MTKTFLQLPYGQLVAKMDRCMQFQVSKGVVIHLMALYDVAVHVN